MDMADTACVRLSEILAAHKIKPILLITDIGENCPLDTMGGQFVKLEQTLHICNFFKCNAIKVCLGSLVNERHDMKLLNAWMADVATMCLEADVVPTIELSWNLPVSEPAAIATLLKQHKRWSIIYDPAALVMHKRIDPFTKYWSLLKSRVSHIDIHDFQIGKSPRPPGHGDAKLDLTISDATNSNFNGWYCLEPGMGRRYGSIITKQGVFLNALQVCDRLFNRLGG